MFEENQAHVWRALIGHFPPSYDLLRTLSPDEHARADRFRFDADRWRFATARGVLRTLLGRCVRRDPVTLRFRYSDRGKPALILAPGDPDLRFNVSHTSRLALFAFAVGFEVGVDAEEVRPGGVDLAIARRFFAAEDYSHLESLPANERDVAFYRYWTRHEALAKASGAGLSGPLADSSQWTVLDLDPGSGTVGALAAPMPQLSVKLFECTDQESR
jgi:4'-phosphopantetheinyl transferase